MDRFVLINDRIRRNAITAIMHAPERHVVAITGPKRSKDQNAKFHAILTDIARSHVKWAGKRRTVEEWKALIISGHAVATKSPGEVIPGLEGEFLAIRESSASMSVARAASLIEYTLAFCADHQIELRETVKQGFLNTGAPFPAPVDGGRCSPSRPADVPSPSASAGSHSVEAEEVVRTTASEDSASDPPPRSPQSPRTYLGKGMTQ